MIKSAEGTPAGGYAIHGEYVAELARQLLYNVYQDNLYSRGINIYTTVQSKDQESAYRAVRDGVLEYAARALPGPEEQLDMPAGVENDPQALDEFLDGVFDKFSDERRPADRRRAVGQPHRDQAGAQLARSHLHHRQEGAGRGGAGADGQGQARDAPEARLGRLSTNTTTTGKSSTCRRCRPRSWRCR